MQLSVTQFFLIILLVVLVSYVLHKRSVKTLEKQLGDAEELAARADKDYLAVLQENEVLKQEIFRQQDEQAKILSIQESLKKKKA